MKPLPAAAFAILLLLAGAVWWAGRQPSPADPAARPGAPAPFAGEENPAAGPLRGRNPRTPTDSRFAAEFIGFLREALDDGKDGPSPDSDFEERAAAFRDRLDNLNRAQVAAVLRALDDAGDLPDLKKGEMKGFLLLRLGDRDPAGAIAVLPETGWLARPDVGKTWLVTMIIENAAENARSDGRRTAALEAFKNLPGGLPPETGDRFFSGLGDSLARNSFDSAAAWMEDARLAPDEAAAVIAGIPDNLSVAPPELWAEWIADTLPPAEAAATLTEFARRIDVSDPFAPPRNETIRKILGHWPAGDPAGRLEALREHGLAD